MVIWFSWVSLFSIWKCPSVTLSVRQIIETQRKVKKPGGGSGLTSVLINSFTSVIRDLWLTHELLGVNLQVWVTSLFGSLENQSGGSLVTAETRCCCRWLFFTLRSPRRRGGNQWGTESSAGIFSEPHFRPFSLTPPRLSSDSHEQFRNESPAALTTCNKSRLSLIKKKNPEKHHEIGSKSWSDSWKHPQKQLTFSNCPHVHSVQMTLRMPL